MYLDDEPPIAGGRKSWGLPKKQGRPRFELVHDTQNGTLEYAGVQVTVGTMGYKRPHLFYDVLGNKACPAVSIVDKLSQTQVNLKLIPGVDGALALAQLNACNLADLEAQGAWSGAAGFNGVHPANAPVADLLARHVPAGLHFIANLTLPCDRVVFDYLAP